MARPRKPWYRSDRNAWYVEVDGRQQLLVRGPKNAATKAQAQQQFHTLMAEHFANQPVDGDTPTVASIIDAFLDYAVRRDAKRTFYERKLYLQSFAETHGLRLVKDCVPYHLTSWVDSHPTWKSDWTTATAVRLIKRPFNWAVTQGLISKNPFATVSQRVGAPRRPMTLAEFRRLVRALGPIRHLTAQSRSSRIRFLEILVFLSHTGARPSELRALKWSHVDLERCEILLHQHKTSRTQRDPKPRRIPLVPAIVRLLIRIRRRDGGNQHVFLTHLGTPWARASISQRLQRLRIQANVPDDAKLYGVRHHFGTQAILNGVDLKTLSELMGHTTTRMTEHYLHLAGEFKHLHAAMRQATSGRSSV